MGEQAHGSPIKTVTVDDLDEDEDENEGDLGLDIDKLSKRVREKSKSARKGFAEERSIQEEESKYPNKYLAETDENGNKVIGIGDFRRALKESKAEIQTYQDHSAFTGAVDRSGVSKKRALGSSGVEKELRSLEKKSVKPTPPRSSKKYEGELEQTPEASYSSSKRPISGPGLRSSTSNKSKIPAVKRKP